LEYFHFFISKKYFSISLFQKKYFSHFLCLVEISQAQAEMENKISHPTYYHWSHEELFIFIFWGRSNFKFGMAR